MNQDIFLGCDCPYLPLDSSLAARSIYVDQL